MLYTKQRLENAVFVCETEVKFMPQDIRISDPL